MQSGIGSLQGIRYLTKQVQNKTNDEKRTTNNTKKRT